LLASAALLRALRLNTKGSWLLYVVTLAVSFYTFLFSALVAAGHGLYVLVLEKFRLSRTTVGFVAAGVCAVVLFVPWVVAVAGNFSRVQQTTNWEATEPIPAREQFRKLVREGWVRHPGRTFFDLNTSDASPALYHSLQKGFTGLCLVVVAFSLLYLWRSTEQRTWLFVFALIGVPGMALVLQDLLLKGQGGETSIIPRYQIPC
jgi:uncharacterized membrane protein